MNIKNQWGLFFFLSAVLLCCAGVAVGLCFPYAANKPLYITILPSLGFLFSLTAFFAGHFSYPRVHNLKVYLLGYLTGLFGIAYFVFFRFLYPLPLPGAARGYVVALYCLMFVNSVGVLFVPSFVKYRTVRKITLTVVTVEGVLLIIGRLSPLSTAWASALFYDTMWDFRFFLGAIVFGAVLAISLRRIRKEFFLGGLLAGWALFFASAWTARFFFRFVNPMETALFAIMPLYATVGVLVHWFLRMEQRIAYDPLLQIYNRDYCSRIISEQSNLNVSPPFAVVMVDIDHFKNVNDTYGHQAGDQVLFAVAQAICKEVVPDGTVCRYGGEEIVIFFPQKTIKSAEPIVENVRAAIEKMKTKTGKTGKKTLGVTVSCGVSCKEQLSTPIIDVIHSADKAMYKAKEGGRNRVRTAKTTGESARKK
jgi:diguanylate cyclase (GGDEF)-like protein